MVLVISTTKAYLFHLREEEFERFVKREFLDVFDFVTGTGDVVLLVELELSLTIFHIVFGLRSHTLVVETSVTEDDVPPSKAELLKPGLDVSFEPIVLGGRSLHGIT